eukprot:CAMPEP_0170568336 /NCGR_PEP_ID=MMETSP0211-20121228/81114_1 /TAXON_ID=311385 /ORGANISM="Pseudokeronopsis sp., Strain OXSARD2" /LENGTH=66 /DNA_ID=CAMNT_0010890163 /DNA_START=1240 /DNA_END=1440 /DNA_ORIENTATION=+
MGFEGVGILLKDQKSQELYTITENVELLNGIYENGDEFRSTTIIRFPTSMGISGYAYTNGELYFTN